MAFLLVESCVWSWGLGGHKDGLGCIAWVKIRVW